MAYSYNRRSKQASFSDNSYGLGFYPLPPKLRGLGRFSDGLKPANLLNFKYVPQDGVFMLDTKLSYLSVLALDLKALLAQGLYKIQSNDPGVVSFYFGGFKGEVPIDRAVAQAHLG